MDRRLLNLVPKRYLCPLCGEWHKWNDEDYDNHELEWYDSPDYQAKLRCSDWPKGGYAQPLFFYFENGFCYFSTPNHELCPNINGLEEGDISIEDMVEHADKPIVTFEANVDIISNSFSGCNHGCNGDGICNYHKLGINHCFSDNQPMTVTLGFEFDRDEYLEISKVMQNAEAEKRNAPANSGTSIKSESISTGTSNMFGLNIEFGQNNDANLVSTLMGVAVKNNNSWRIYDKSKKQITDVGNMEIGGFPIFIMPTTKLSEGDLIKENGEYYYVMATENGTTKTICPTTGQIKTIVPTKNIFGISVYSKVVALCDCFSNDEHKLSNEKLALMSVAFSQPSNGENNINQLLPLFLLNNKHGKEINNMQMIFMLSAMNNFNSNESTDSCGYESHDNDDDEYQIPYDNLPF